MAPQPKRLIALKGPIGAGKSTLGKALQERLGAAYLEVDAFKRVFPGGSSSIRKMVGQQAALYQLRLLLQLGLPVIVEEMFRSTDDFYERVTSLAERHGYHCASFHLQCGVDVSLARNRQRDYNVDENVVRERHAVARPRADDIVLDTGLLGPSEALAAVLRHIDTNSHDTNHLQESL
jgi:predicted kinase